MIITWSRKSNKGLAVQEILARYARATVVPLSPVRIIGALGQQVILWRGKQQHLGFGILDYNEEFPGVINQTVFRLTAKATVSKVVTGKALIDFESFGTKRPISEADFKLTANCDLHLGKTYFFLTASVQVTAYTHHETEFRLTAKCYVVKSVAREECLTSDGNVTPLVTPGIDNIMILGS